MKINPNLNKLAAIILGKVISKMYPNAILGNFGLLEEGFFYNFDLKKDKISVNDFEKISNSIQKEINANATIKYESISKTEALKLFAKNKFKKELINDMSSKKIDICKIGQYVDLCEDLGITKTSEVKLFELLNVSGAY